MSKASDNTFLRRLRSSPLAGMFAAVLFVAVLLGLLVRSGGHEQILGLLRWVEMQGLWAPLFFILIIATAVVLVLPGLPLTAGAGFVFGVVAGSIYVVLGTTLGAVLSFLIARYFFGARARRFMLSHPRLHAVGAEVTPRGGRIVLLTRLIPFFPSKLANYFFGLTPLHLRDYTFGSLLGFIPFSVHNVYLGSIAADISTLTVRDLARTPLQWALYGGGFVTTIIAVVWLNRLAQRALKPYTNKESSAAETQS